MINIEQRLLININWRIFYFCLLLIYVIKCTKQQMQYVVSTSIFYVLYESTLSVDIHNNYRDVALRVLEGSAHNVPSPPPHTAPSPPPHDGAHSSPRTQVHRSILWICFYYFIFYFLEDFIISFFKVRSYRAKI